MHGHNCAGAFSNLALDGRGVDRERCWIGVSEHWQGHARQDRVVTCDECVRRDNHLVPGVHVQSMQADHERGRAAGGGQAALGTQQSRVSLFKLLHVLAGTAEPAPAPEHFEHLWFPGFAPLWPLQPAAFVNRCSSEKGRLGRLGCKSRRRPAITEPAKRKRASCRRPDETTSCLCGNFIHGFFSVLLVALGRQPQGHISWAAGLLRQSSHSPAAWVAKIRVPASETKKMGPP